MTIPYTVDRNPFKEEGYAARVKSAGTAALDDIADRIVARGSTVGKADLLAVLSLLEDVCIELVLEGRRVHLGDLVRVYCSISGDFDGLDDAYDPSRHQLKGTARAGPRLNEALEKRAKVRKEPARRPSPNPQELIDVVTEAKDRLTPGGMVRLLGERLKFDPAAEDEGVFLIDAAGAEHRVEHFAQNTPKLLIFSPPALPAGEYQLEVRSRTRFTPTLRVGRLSERLSVIQ